MFSGIKCSFFGHRDIEVTEELKQRLEALIEDLIVNHNVNTFLFGSRSDFDALCHSVVTALKEKYPDIRRAAYTCRSETRPLMSEKREWERIRHWFEMRSVRYLWVEENCDYKSKYKAGRASYVVRNQAMIDDSKYCIFYYDENYLPEKRKYSKHNCSYYQPKSGTKLAYDYAKKKRRIIFNVK